MLSTIGKYKPQVHQVVEEKGIWGTDENHLLSRGQSVEAEWGHTAMRWDPPARGAVCSAGDLGSTPGHGFMPQRGESLEFATLR